MSLLQMLQIIKFLVVVKEVDVSRMPKFSTGLASRAIRRRIIPTSSSSILIILWIETLISLILATLILC